MSTTPHPERIAPSTEQESIQALRALLGGISEAPDAAWQQFNVGAMRKLLTRMDERGDGRAERTLAEVRRILTPGLMSVRERTARLKVTFDAHDAGK